MGHLTLKTALYAHSSDIRSQKIVIQKIKQSKLIFKSPLDIWAHKET